MSTISNTHIVVECNEYLYIYIYMCVCVCIYTPNHIQTKCYFLLEATFIYIVHIDEKREWITIYERISLTKQYLFIQFISELFPRKLSNLPEANCLTYVERVSGYETKRQESYLINCVITVIIYWIICI